MCLKVVYARQKYQIIPARDPKQCGESKRKMYYNADDDVNVDEDGVVVCCC